MKSDAALSQDAFPGKKQRVFKSLVACSWLLGVIIGLRDVQKVCTFVPGNPG
jgi:hypothetical protein